MSAVPMQVYSNYHKAWLLVVVVDCVVVVVDCVVVVDSSILL
jgi:hypothetical protein